jgi:serine/threonine protein kinase
MWAAPEVMIEDAQCDESSDVYSFGVVLFEFLYREMPYKSLDPKSIMYSVSSGKRPDAFASSKAAAKILQLSPALVPLLKLMKRCWSTDPEARPKFHDILTRLEKVRRTYFLPRFSQITNHLTTTH